MSFNSRSREVKEDTSAWLSVRVGESCVCPRVQVGWGQGEGEMTLLVCSPSDVTFFFILSNPGHASEIHWFLFFLISNLQCPMHEEGEWRETAALGPSGLSLDRTQHLRRESLGSDPQGNGVYKEVWIEGSLWSSFPQCLTKVLNNMLRFDNILSNQRVSL